MDDAPAERGGIRIRRARPEDAEAVADLLDHALADKFRPAFGARSLDAVRAFVRADIRSRPRRRLVAERARVAVGTVSLSVAGNPAPALIGPVRDELGAWAAARAFIVLSTLGARQMQPGEAFVEELAVAPDARRGGIGRRLLASCEDAAREAGCARLCLNVTSDNAPALALYEDFGLRVTRRDRWFLRRAIFGAPGSLTMGMALLD